jgi:hypothetical protein
MASKLESLRDKVEEFAHSASDRPEVEFLDGSTEVVPTDQISAYVTEASNSGTGHGVALVRVRGQWSMLQPGVVLVDTPGLASLHQHNTEAGRAALLDAYGAIVVPCADSPATGQALAEEDRQHDEERPIDLERLGAQLAELGGPAR